MHHRDERYFKRIEDELDRAMMVAKEAKRRGDDPRPEIEIPTARDMADRVENILGIDGVAARVREFEAETDLSREEIALSLVEDFVAGEVGDYSTDAGKIEGAVRTAVALLTEGVVAAPIEGIDRVEVNRNDDDTTYVAVYYAGPIRSAGGTAQALSVLVADYARTLLGIDRFKPRDDEIERYAEEVDLYDAETGLQYSPKNKETKYIVKHCPIMLDGEATGEEEVSGYRDLERIDTNAPRGGMCLVLAEGIALKAPKIKRYTRDLDELAWPWLQDLIDGTIGAADMDEKTASEKAADDPETEENDQSEQADPGPPRVDTSEKYLRDLIAGRPVFGHPGETGGFRLRYGRTRNLGDATAGVHPATMRIVDDFLAPGTQIKTELPGKAAGIVPVDSIEGPMVRLADGEVRRINDATAATELRNGIDRIIDLGEYLVNYGEFVENNHELAPASYVQEWWSADMTAAGADMQALEDDVTVDLADPDPETAMTWAREYEAPLHPRYTYLWHDLTVEEFEQLATTVAEGEIKKDTLHVAAGIAPLLEKLLIEHIQEEQIVRIPTWQPLVRSLGLTTTLERTWHHETLPKEALDWPNAMRVVNAVAPFEIQERAPTRIGSRMGRPEKSQQRELSPAVHTLFPIGDAGGDQRNVTAAAGHADSLSDTPGEIEVEVGLRYCVDCDVETYWPRCPECDSHLKPQYTCPDCGQTLTPDDSGRVHCDRCDTDGSAVETRTVDVGTQYREALEAVGERETAFEILKGVKGLSSELKTPEPLEKGILRAKHGVSAFKDGTVRYDMTDLPVTSVTPAELGVSVDRFRQLGYQEDIHGDPLRHEDQLVELKVQDVILSEGAAEHMLKTADFVDDLLESYYGLDPYYELEQPDDLVGELVFGMAPHTSAAVVGRVVGFTNVAGGYAHPYFHAAKRRNCFHPDTKLWYRDRSGRWHHDRIDKLVEAELEAPRTDDFGTQIQELEGEIYAPSRTSTGQRSLQPITAVSKHPAPEHLVRIETASGRRITVTPDHDVHVVTGEQLQAKRAAEVTATDQLAVPTRIEVDAGAVPDRDLLAAALTQSTTDNAHLAIEVEPEELAALIAAYGGRQQDNQDPYRTLGTQAGADETAITTARQHHQIPVSWLRTLGDPEAIGQDLSKTIQVTDGRQSLDRNLKISNRIAWLLGYYTAVGQVNTGEAVTDPVIRFPAADADVQATLREVLATDIGADPSVEKETISVDGQVAVLLFASGLDAGGDTDTKRVPQWLFDAPNEVVAAYLGGYFDGGEIDGESRTAVVDATLREDLLALGHRLGIIGETAHSTVVDCPNRFLQAEENRTLQTTARITIPQTQNTRYRQTVGQHRRKGKTTKPPVPVHDGGSATQDYRPDPVETVTYVQSDVEYVYAPTVAETHSVIANNLSQKQCDGDEDCVMLLLDGLLNFSKAYLPDKRGGSVTADARIVAVDPNDTIRFLTIEELWQTIDAEIIQTGKFKKKACRQTGWKTYAFDKNHQASLQPIEKAIRYPAADDDRVLRITTQFGRTIEITPSHSLFRYDGTIEEVAGDELSVGDLIVAPQTLDIETTAVGDETPTAAADGGSKAKPPATTAPTATQAASLTTEAAWAVGYILANGTVTDTGIRITDCPDTQRTRLHKGLQTLCQSEAHQTEITIEAEDHSSTVWAALDMLEEAPTAAPRGTHLPQQLLTAPPEVCRAMLRGLFGLTADQGPATDQTVTVDTETLRDGIIFLCHRLGIVAGITTRTQDDTSYTVRLGQTAAAALCDPSQKPEASLQVAVPKALCSLRSLAGEASPVPEALEPGDQISVAQLRTVLAELEKRSLPSEATTHLETLRALVQGDLSYLRVEDIESIAYEGYLYDLQVGGEPIFTADWLYAHNSMDAPLVMSSRIDPSEIDDEAHNIDIMNRYPREFYEATRELAKPEEIDDQMIIAEDRVGTEDEYHGFVHTHETSDIAAGPDLSAYKTLGSMTDKMDAQLELARQLRSVNETDVAERIIEYHFLPDLIGNLRAFSRQETRCLDCGTKFRRAPLTGECRVCGGDVTLTVHEGSVTKYLETALRIAEEYGTREYTKQRLEVLERSIERIFEDDTSRQSGIADFM